MKQLKEKRQELLDVVKIITQHLALRDTYTQEELEWLVDINIKLLAIVKTL